MIDIQKVDHIGIRISDREVSVGFYESLGFTASHIGFKRYLD